MIVHGRVVAKKIVSQLRFSSSWSTFFARATPWMQGYQASCLHDGGCSTRKENTLNMCSDTQGTCIVVRNLFQTFYLHVGSDIVQIWSDGTYTCVQPKNELFNLHWVIYPTKSSQWSPQSFSAHKFCQQSALSDNPAIIVVTHTSVWPPSTMGYHSLWACLK